MNVHGEDITPYITPETHDIGLDGLPLTATFHNPFMIERWRKIQYIDAVHENLPDGLAASYEDAQLLTRGCTEAANRATDYLPFQEDSQLTPEESAVLRTIGDERFLAIARMSPPVELIDYMLSRSTDKFAPALESITGAVIKGDLEWEERFAEAGVPRPEEFIEQKLALARQKRARIAEAYADPQPQPTTLTLLGRAARALFAPR